MPPRPQQRVRPPPRSARTSRAQVVGTRVPAILQWGRHSKCRDSLTVGQEEPKAATGARVREGLAGAPEWGRVPGAASGGGGREEACGLCRVRCGHSGPPKPAGDPPAGPRRGGASAVAELREATPALCFVLSMHSLRGPPHVAQAPSPGHPPTPGSTWGQTQGSEWPPWLRALWVGTHLQAGRSQPPRPAPSLCLPQAEQPPTLGGQSAPSPGPSLPLPRRLRPSFGPQCGTAAGSHPRTRPETDGNPSAVGRTASPQNPVRPERQNGTSLGNSPCRM